MENMKVSQILDSSLVDDDTSIVIRRSCLGTPLLVSGRHYEDSIMSYSGYSVSSFTWERGNLVRILVKEGGGD